MGRTAVSAPDVTSAGALARTRAAEIIAEIELLTKSNPLAGRLCEAFLLRQLASDLGGVLVALMGGAPRAPGPPG